MQWQLTRQLSRNLDPENLFLGRLVEELMLQTSADCLILDPNADFRKVQEVEESSLWEKANYNALARKGKLPHEASRDEFASLWADVTMRIRTGPDAMTSGSERLQIWWPSLSMTFLAEDLDPMLRSGLYHCHNFVKDFGQVFEFKYSTSKSSTIKKPKDLLEEVQKLFERLRSIPKKELPRILTQEFNASQIINGLKPKRSKSGTVAQDDYVVLVFTSPSKIELFNLFRNVISYSKSVLNESAKPKFYF